VASRVINMSIPEQLLRQIDDVARAEGYSRSELFRQAARNYVEGRRSQRKSAEPVLSRLVALAKKGPDITAADLDARLYGRGRR
jgi:metal-responsive CopG/Arc/MetJ family transcriptional regulator